MFNVFKTNYRNFPSSLTKLRFLHYSRYLKNINELKENNIQSTSNLIPSEIEQNLQRWEKGIKLSFDFSENPNVNQLQNQWMGLSLECVDIKQHPSPFITLSTKNVCFLYLIIWYFDGNSEELGKHLKIYFFF